MLGASLYITLCSARNRLRVRLRRLREPRYLVGAVAGAAYLYFTVFARMWGRRAAALPQRRVRRPPADMSLEAFQAAGPALVGLGLLTMMTSGWLLPSDSDMLAFTDAEVQFLFPAPVSRRQLLLHRLLRSQLGILFAAIVPALFFPSGSAGGRAKFAVAMWVILVTIRVHFTGVTLARASLTMPGADVRRRQWGPPAVMLAALGIVVAAVARAVVSHPISRPGDVLDLVGEISTTGASHVILWPFMTLARPLFAPWPGPFLAALALALAILAANVAWVLRSDAAFQEAVAQAEARRAARKQKAQPVTRARATRWTLRLSGRPELIFLWKAAMQALRETSLATFMRYGAPLIVLTVSIASIYLRLGNLHGAAALTGTLAAGFAVMVVLFGPQIARTDLRQDLLHLELLKTWPLPSSAVVRGELLWPGAALTAVAWAAIACAMLLSSSAFRPFTLAWRVSAALGAAALVPALVFAQLTIHNTAALLFPAWVPLGSARARGVDAMGQRLIMFAGVLLGLIGMLLPGAIVGGVLWFVLHGLIGAFALALGAGACTAVVLFEVLAATEALGPAYERLDLTAVERAE